MLKKLVFLFLFLSSILMSFNCSQTNNKTPKTNSSNGLHYLKLIGFDKMGQNLQVIQQKTIEQARIPVIDYDSIQWTDIAFLDKSIIIDMRYATVDNFVEEKMYECGRCFLRPEFAKLVVQMHKELKEQDLGLKMLDCFRPRPIQWKLWEKVPDPRYVADPRKGSMHNRGLAVDLTIVDKDGKQLDMGTKYDYFGREAYHAYTNLPDSIMANRHLLKSLMLKYELKPTSTEWWHYSYTKKRYPLSDMLWNCD